MGASRDTPQRLRIGLPILTAANAGLLVAAHLSNGAATVVTGHAPLGTLKPHVATEDNLISAVHRLAQAHVWLMVVIVAVLSGVWPYLKLMLTLGVVALTDMGTFTRETGCKWLSVLEVLGKYSFADVVLICFNAVIFDISTGGDYQILLVGSLELNLYMQLQFGSIALIVAVTFSAFLTHWAAHELGPSLPGRKARELAAGQATEEAPLLPEDAAGGRQEATPWVGFGTALAALVGLVLLAVGSAISSIEVDRNGFLGNLIRPHSDKDLQMSIFSITFSMLANGRSRDDGATVFFAILFAILTFVVPLLELTALAGCGLASAFKSRRNWARAFEQLAAWLTSFGVVDCFLLVCLAVLFEVKTVVDFNLGDECKPFADIMDNKVLLAIAGLGFAASDSCFEPHPILRSGWWVLLVSVLFRTAAWRGVAVIMQPPEHSMHEA